MSRWLAALVLLGLGCTGATDHGAEAAPTPKARAAGKDPKMANELTWKLAKQGGKLHVTYHFANHTGGVVYVNDGLVAQVGNNTFLKITNNVDVEVLDPQTVLITVGTPSGDVPAAVPVPGFYVAVAKGAAFDGARDVPLPLSRSDAMGRVTMLGDKFTKASFALYVSDGEPATWRELPTAKGTVRIPDGPNIRIVKTESLPLP